MGFDDAVITGEFKRLDEAFTEGASENSSSLPLTALVVQVLVLAMSFHNWKRNVL